MQNEKSLPYELTMKFEDHRVETAYAMNPQQLMCTVFHHFENFRDDMIPVHSEYNQAGQLCFWELTYGGAFPKDLYPQVAGQSLLINATIRNLVWQPVETYPLAKTIEVPHRRYVWACIEDGVVTGWRDFEPTTDNEQAVQRRRVMIEELGRGNARVKTGLVKGRTLHIVKVPGHLRPATPKVSVAEAD